MMTKCGKKVSTLFCRDFCRTGETYVHFIVFKAFTRCGEGEEGSQAAMEINDLKKDVDKLATALLL